MRHLIPFLVIIMMFGAISYSLMGKSKEQTSYIENTSYFTLELPYEKDTVWTVYSVYCPFCRRFEKSVIPHLIIPKGVVYDEIYLYRMGEYGYYAAMVLAALKVRGEGYEEVKELYFTEVIDKKNADIASGDYEAFIDMGLNVAGLSKDEFKALLETDDVLNLLDKWKSISVPVAVKNGIPAIVVNGRYLINLEFVKDTDELNALIAYLLKKSS